MRRASMTSSERVRVALGQREPDRVPFFLLLGTNGAKELGVSIREYYSRPENVVEGQLRMRAKYRHDCLTAFFYASVEMEAWGGETTYYDDGPPNAGQPLVRTPEEICRLEVPRVRDCACLGRVLDATRMLRTRVGNDAPVIGVVLSPFSLPVMQMGFDSYFDLMYERPELFHRLMALNEQFCVEWASAQLDAGATVIAYFDPVSSPSMIPRELFLKTGFQVARRTISRIGAPIAILMASARCLPILGDLALAGSSIVGASALEDLAEVKAACRGEMAVLGNLNGLEMRRWTPEMAEAAVKEAIAKAGRGGGFVLSDSHGEIPWQVPERVLLALSESVHRWGRYPLDWIEEGGD